MLSESKKNAMKFFAKLSFGSRFGALPRLPDFYCETMVHRLAAILASSQAGVALLGSVSISQEFTDAERLDYCTCHAIR